MTSAEQADANRRNAENSTGPRTVAGKARSSRNALKHGLSADQVVIWDEDPAAFEALRSDLLKHYQPADPIAEHLVEHVAACLWRLRRVPEIEAGIYSHFYFRRQRGLAIDRVSAQEDYSFGPVMGPTILDDEAYAKAERDQKRAETSLHGHLPVRGEVFRDAEHSLSSLVRIAGAIEGSMYRAMRELERMKAERPEPVEEKSVIDVEIEEEDLPWDFE